MTPVNGISVERAGPVATVWLDRPDRGNGFISAMQVGCMSASPNSTPIRRCGRSSSPAAASSSPRAPIWARRGQLRLRRRADRARPADDGAPAAPVADAHPDHRRDERRGRRAGLTFPMQWDIRIVNETAGYGFVFTRRGLIPEQNSLWILPRLVGFSTAIELLLTGRLFTGAEAAQMGIATQALPGSIRCWSGLAEIADEIAAQTAPLAVGLTKQLAYELLACDDREAAFHREWGTSAGWAANPTPPRGGRVHRKTSAGVHRRQERAVAAGRPGVGGSR